jgi:hypothetical protein
MRVHRHDSPVLRRPGLARRTAIALCIALLLGMVISYVVLLRGGDAGPKQTDFVPYYSAARLLVLGHGGQIYHLPALGRFEAALVHPLRIPDGVMPFLYPPYTALLFAPLGAIPYVPAFLGWLAINVLLLLATIGLLVRYSRLRGADALLLGAASISFLPALVAISQGQVSILLLFLLTGTLLAIRSGRDYSAGILLAFALIKPPCLLPVLVILLVRGRLRVLAALSATTAALLVLSVLVVGPSSLAGYVRTITLAVDWQHQVGGFAPHWNQSVTGFIQLLLPEPTATQIARVLTLMLIGVLTWRVRSDAPFDILFAAAVLCGLLISPHVLLHDLVILILPAAIALHHRDIGPARLAPILAAGYLAVVVTLPLAALIHLQITVLCMAALFAWLLATRRPARAMVPRSADLSTRRPHPAFTYRHLAKD